MSAKYITTSIYFKCCQASYFGLWKLGKSQIQCPVCKAITYIPAHWFEDSSGKENAPTNSKT